MGLLSSRTLTMDFAVNIVEDSMSVKGIYM